MGVLDRSYEDLFIKNNITTQSIPLVPVTPQIPSWEHKKANFDIDYTHYNKDEEINLLVSEVRQHIQAEYSNHLKIFTDGSVLETTNSGAAFVIPSLKVHKCYHLGKGFSIFTSELFAVLKALDFINNFPRVMFKILLCIDSKSVLHTLKQHRTNIRNDLVFEIQFLIHCIRTKGTDVDLCWIPSHCGLYWNEVCDKMAKQGALGTANCISDELGLSATEMCSLLDKAVSVDFVSSSSEILSCNRRIACLIYKLRLNTWKTKHTQTVCICSNALSVHHLFFECPILLADYQKSGMDFYNGSKDVMDILYKNEFQLIQIVQIILQSPIGRLL